MTASVLDRRPLVIALAGPNGAGKTTFYRSQLQASGLRFVNADILAGELGLGAYAAADMATKIREHLLNAGESFVFETVFSDPVGDKVELLKAAALKGYTVVLFFIGVSGAEVSGERVAMRVAEGGHDVPGDKLVSRYPRVLENLAKAIRELPHVWVYDNDDLHDPYRRVVVFEGGRAV